LHRHDTEIFKGLDTLDLNPSLENCVCLIYRSVCREISVKQHVVKVLIKSEIGKDQAFFQKSIAPEIARTVDLAKYKVEVEAAISTGVYSDYEALVFELDTPPSLIGTTTIIPFVTPRGRVLIPRVEWLTMTVLPTSAGGFAILTWNQNGGCNSPIFAHSFRRMGLGEAEMMLPRVLFELSENVAMSPVVWGRLPEFVQQVLLQRHKDCIVDSTDMPSPENSN
jgi:hypothetical protein